MAIELSGSRAFRPYFGTLSPVAVTAAAGGLGALALVYLRTQGWSFARAVSARGLSKAVALAAALAIPVIAIDLFGAFPRDLNVPAPQSLLFYPAIALVAECVFHAVPVALLWLLFQPLSRRMERPGVLWGGVVLAAFIEPVLQAVWAAPDSPGWATAYVSVHVLIINLMLLYFFRRFGFLAAYGVRTLYYLVWHVAWGALRLPMLFGG
ncbi:MAG: hypothetical protein PVJ80_10320 [Gemmatimonadota bacterium]